MFQPKLELLLERANAMADLGAISGQPLENITPAELTAIQEFIVSHTDPTQSLVLSLHNERDYLKNLFVGANFEVGDVVQQMDEFIKFSFKLAFLHTLAVTLSTDVQITIEEFIDSLLSVVFTQEDLTMMEGGYGTIESNDSPTTTLLEYPKLSSIFPGYLSLVVVDEDAAVHRSNLYDEIQLSLYTNTNYNTSLQWLDKYLNDTQSHSKLKSVVEYLLNVLIDRPSVGTSEFNFDPSTEINNLRRLLHQHPTSSVGSSKFYISSDAIASAT
jgi:hypothetical protein